MQIQKYSLFIGIVVLGSAHVLNVLSSILEEFTLGIEILIPLWGLASFLLLIAVALDRSTVKHENAESNQLEERIL